jgi:hypothetical protein
MRSFYAVSLSAEMTLILRAEIAGSIPVSPPRMPRPRICDLPVRDPGSGAPWLPNAATHDTLVCSKRAQRPVFYLTSLANGFASSAELKELSREPCIYRGYSPLCWRQMHSSIGLVRLNRIKLAAPLSVASSYIAMKTTSVAVGLLAALLAGTTSGTQVAYVPRDDSGRSSLVYPANYFDQLIDHFPEEGPSGTFQQRYYVDSTYYQPGVCCAFNKTI